MSINEVSANSNQGIANLFRNYFSSVYSLIINSGLPPITVRDCRYSLALPIYILFKLSLSSSSFPTLWKTSYIQPIFKSGDRSNVENYRPISILSGIPMFFDKILATKINCYFKYIFINEQHGFGPGRSTVTHVLSIHYFLLETIESGLRVDVIYTDLKKAFYEVNHT